MKKNIIVRVLICLTLIFFSVNTFAQEEKKTAYQERVHELAQKYYCIIHHNTENPNNLNFTDRYTMEVFTCQVYDEESYKNLMALLILAKTNELSIGQIESFKNRMTNDLKTTEKLKTAVDFQREKEEDEKKKERELNAKKTDTDKGYLYVLIERDFNKWCNKDVYEKASEHDTRLKNLSAYIFDSICREKIKQLLKYKRLRITKGTYDAESEQFHIKYELWTDRNAAYYSNTQFDGYIGGNKKYSYFDLSFDLKVPIKEAKTLSDLKQVYYEDQLGFYEDNIAYRKIRLEDNYSDFVYGPMFLPMYNCTDVIIYADDMTLNSQYLKGHSFNYTKYDKSTEWEKCKQYFNYSDYISYYNKGEQTFKSELNYRKRVQELKQVFPASANIQEYISLYNKDYNKIDTSVEYYKEVKDKYLVKIFNNKENELYSTFLKYYVKGGGKAPFDTEVARISWYKAYKNLYSNEDEFNEIFKSGKTCFQNDLDARKYVSKYYVYIRSLNEKDYKTLVTNTIYNYDKGIVYTMNVVINGDKAMKKEFENNGSYFNNTKEFFNSYISDTYKADLKAKKKAAKEASK